MIIARLKSVRIYREIYVLNMHIHFVNDVRMHYLRFLNAVRD